MLLVEICAYKGTALVYLHYNYIVDFDYYYKSFSAIYVYILAINIAKLAKANEYHFKGAWHEKVWEPLT